MKKIISFICMLMCCFLISSCGASHIEDTNGEDISLCSLTEEEIFAESPSYLSFGSAMTQLNNNYSFKVSKLSGVYKLDKFSAKGGILVISANTVLEEGNLRIVLICEDEYVADIPVGENQSVTVDDPSGKYEIRLAAESAKLQFEFTYEIR